MAATTLRDLPDDVLRIIFNHHDAEQKIERLEAEVKAYRENRYLREVLNLVKEVVTPTTSVECAPDNVACGYHVFEGMELTDCQRRRETEIEEMPRESTFAVIPFLQRAGYAVEEYPSSRFDQSMPFAVFHGTHYTQSLSWKTYEVGFIWHLPCAGGSDGSGGGSALAVNDDGDGGGGGGGGGE